MAHVRMAITTYMKTVGMAHIEGDLYMKNVEMMGTTHTRVDN
jgi:hypothetical protein